LTGIVAGHVSLDIEGFDRIYLNGYVPKLQTGGQVAGFLHWRGFPIAQWRVPGDDAGLSGGGPGCRGSATAPGGLESGLLVKCRVVMLPPAG
jgi:hypothetical protein